MRRLVPSYILHKYTQDELSGRMPAAALFVDLVGFSTITDTLMQHGQHGAEVLATTMRGVFNPLVEAVYQQGGFIFGFAGWHKDPAMSYLWWVVILIQAGVITWGLTLTRAEGKRYGGHLLSGTLISIYGGIIIIFGSP